MTCSQGSDEITVLKKLLMKTSISIKMEEEDEEEQVQVAQQSNYEL